MKPKKSPPAKSQGTPKGKGTLFSFFSKTPSKPKPLSQDTPSKLKETPSKPKPVSQDASEVARPRTAEASPEQSSEESEELVGKRIKVFWRGDNNWYFGKVIDFSDGKHLIHYEDGDREKLVLKNEKVGRPSSIGTTTAHNHPIVNCNAGVRCAKPVCKVQQQCAEFLNFPHCYHTMFVLSRPV